MNGQPLKLELTPEQLDELARCSETDPQAYMRERCHAVLQVAQGKGIHWVARHGLSMSHDSRTIKTWISIYQAEGLVGLLLWERKAARLQGLKGHARGHSRKPALVLTDEQVQELLSYRLGHPKTRVRERCAAILMIADGKAAGWVARYGLVTPRSTYSVFKWVAAYRASGISGLVERGHIWPSGGDQAISMVVGKSSRRGRKVEDRSVS